jgi:serpin B
MKRNWLIVCGLCIFVVGAAVAIGVPYYISYKRVGCDRAAQADGHKLAAALERLSNELVDLNCPLDQWTVTEQHLRYLTGPYYGFRGGSSRCDVRIAARGDEIQVCSLKGSIPDGSESRYLYRLSARLAKQGDLPTTVGPCSGSRYPALGPNGEEMCFTESMVARDCTMRFGPKPRSEGFLEELRACEDIQRKRGGQVQHFRKLADNSVNVFSLDMYRRLSGGDHNLVYSPFSIFCPLAMAWEGASGATREEMGRVLHLDRTSFPVHTVLGGLVNDVDCSVLKGDGLLRTANGLWGQKGYGFLKSYQDFLRTHYGLEIQEVDYGRDAEGSVAAINSWVEKQTAGRIREMVQNVPPGTGLMVVNAIYFNSTWADPFPKGSTKDEEFTLLNGEKIMVPMMGKHLTDCRYFERPDFQAVELDYQGRTTSMVVFLPRKKDGLPTFEKEITPERLSEWIGGFEKWQAGVIVHLPRFFVSTRFSAQPQLEQMGMKTAFQRFEGDFTGISGERPRLQQLFIAGFIHAAGIDVNEEGTEAWAASMACSRITGLDGDPDPTKPKIFRADHPFMFIIRHKQTNAILFMGRVMNPQSS